MQVVDYLFGKPPPVNDTEPYWPIINDARHGYVPGLRLFPQYATMTDAAFRDWIAETITVPEKRFPGILDIEHVTDKFYWKSLDTRFDQCVGQCECLPGRDMPLQAITIHFSCIQHGLEKPGKYETDYK